MATPVEFLVSASGQMSVPAAVRHRWGLDQGGRVTAIDLGDAVVRLPAGARPVRDLACLREDPRAGHRAQGRALAAARVEALAGAHRLNGGIAVSAQDVGPHLRAAAEADDVAFHIL